jgi:hypothetical protein
MEDDWFRRFLQDYGAEKTKLKPSPIPWARWYLSQILFDTSRGTKFAKRIKKTTLDLAQDVLTTMQDLVLDNDVDTVSFQLERERERDIDEEENEKAFELHNQNSLVQFAVLNGNEEMLEFLWNETDPKHRKEYFNKGDLITGFTPFHIAIFVENARLLELLVFKYEVDVDRKDNFFGTAFDYGKMLGRIPSPTFGLRKLKIWNPDTKNVDQISIKEFESLFNVTFMPYITSGQEYIEELFFSGFSISKPDMQFRKKYFPLIYQSSGDENLVIAKINDQVGFGVFAGKDFQEGDYIVRYGGKITETGNNRTNFFD